MPLSTIGMGPVEQVLNERQQNNVVAAANFRAGADIVQFATQARLSLRSQALQERSLGLEQSRLNLATLDFQQRSQLFEFQKEKWTLERRQIESALALSDAMLPVEKLKIAATLQAGQRQLEGQAEFEAFGSDAIGAIQQDAVQQKRAITDGRVPESDPGLLDLFRLYPNLMTHPEVVKVQDAAAKDVMNFRERWMMTAGRASSGRGGSTLAQDFFTWQRLKQTDPTVAAEFERDVLNNRYKSEDPEVQAALLKLKSVYSSKYSLPEDAEAAEKRYLDAVARVRSRQGMAPDAQPAPSPDYDDFLNMQDQGLIR